MKTETLTLINSSVATSFSGGIYADIPYNARIVGIDFSLVGSSNAANTSEMVAEVSTNIVNQYAGGTGKNILATCGNAGVANASAANKFVPMDMPVKAGQRIFLNALNLGANWVRHTSVATLVLAV